MRGIHDGFEDVDQELEEYIVKSYIIINNREGSNVEKPKTSL